MAWAAVGAVAGPFVDLVVIRAMWLVLQKLLDYITGGFLEAIGSPVILETEKEAKVSQHILVEIAEKARFLSLFWWVRKLYGLLGTLHIIFSSSKRTILSYFGDYEKLATIVLFSMFLVIALIIAIGGMAVVAQMILQFGDCKHVGFPIV